MERIFINSMQVPASILWINSSAKKKADERERKRLLGEMKQSAGKPGEKAGGDSAKQPTPKREPRNNPTEADLDGFLECKHENLSLPKEIFNSDFRACKAGIRKGQACPYGKNCRNKHGPLSSWPRDKAKVLVKAVDADEKLSFVGVDADFLQVLRKEIQHLDE